MSEATKTVVVRSTPLPRKVFRVFIELEGMYRNMVEQLVLYAVRNGITSFTRLKALKYRELRSLYPQLPSHYAYTVCQDASTRAKSFLKLKKRGLTRRDYPEVNRVSIWLDDHLWRLKSLMSIEIATHKGWVTIELEPHKQYWKYLNGGWRLASEAKVKLDKKNRRLIVYLVFKKCVEMFKPRGFISVDVNENHVAVLVDDKAFLFETGFRDIVLGYYYRRKRIQERYDKLYGASCRARGRILKRLKERRKKSDLKWKLANIVVRVAREKQYAVVLEELGEEPAKEMINNVKDDQLRHRIYQASFKGVQRAIEEKAREHGVPVIYIDPKNTSRMCPVHNAKIVYSNGCRIGRCSKGGELWHRDVVACYNLLLRARVGNGSNAPSLRGLSLDGSPMPLGSTATHDPTVVTRTLWARWKSLDKTLKNPKIKGMTI
ncbi:MAG: transposase [Desulfurococcaceae archaeon]|nr:transposase [Desulfurococcaceae archaeon]